MATTKKQKDAINKVVEATKLVEWCRANDDEFLEEANQLFLKASSEMIKAFRM